MKGTEKQIAWAEDIKRRYIADCEKSGEIFLGRIFMDWCKLNGKDHMSFVKQAAESIDDARTWIDFRNGGFFAEVKKVAGFTAEVEHEFWWSSEYEAVRKAERAARRAERAAVR